MTFPMPFFIPVVSAAGYITTAVTFDGTADHLSDANPLSDGQTLAFSLWAKFDTDNTRHILFYTDNGRTLIERTTGNKIRFYTETSGGSALVNVSGTTDVLASSGWVHIAVSINLATPTIKMYVNGADQGGSASSGTAAFKSGSTNLNFFGLGGSLRFDGDTADLWMAQTYIDFSSSTNLEKFRSPAGKPVDLGADGSTPTGAQPPYFLKGTASTFANNLGSAGACTVTGALADAASSPSD